jgi:hypothetical protein
MKLTVEAQVEKGKENEFFGAVMALAKGYSLPDLSENLRKPVSVTRVDILKEECCHDNIIPYHDSSILCKDCHKVIWQDFTKPYPEEYRERLEKQREIKYVH